MNFKKSVVLSAGLILAMSPVAFAANNPRLATDFQSIMEWLSKESSEGMAFHSAISFDPPVELRPYQMGFDYTMGLGTIPLHKNTFPTLQVQTLQDVHPEQSFSDTTPFPDMTGHLRMALPGRFEIAGRASNMTVPRHAISPTTDGEGQSNILGGEIRYHMGDPRLERVTIYGTYDYMFGHFKFFNSFKDIPVQDGITLNSKNEGLLAWSMKTVGLGFTISHEWGQWVPYYGFGYHYSFGSVHTKLTSKFDTPIVAPITGEGVHRVKGTEHMRATLGTMKHGRHVSWYGATEVLVLGSRAGRAWAVHLGMFVPVKAPAFLSSKSSKAKFDSRNTSLRPEKQDDLKDAPNEEPMPAPSSMILLH